MKINPRRVFKQNSVLTVSLVNKLNEIRDQLKVVGWRAFIYGRVPFLVKFPDGSVSSATISFSELKRDVLNYQYAAIYLRPTRKANRASVDKARKLARKLLTGSARRHNLCERCCGSSTLA